MLIQYFNQSDLAYTSRKRFNVFNYTPFNSEEQKAVKLGNGASTSIKTSKSNICNYVLIDNTRWFVVSYIYHNGGQVELFLQRDVIGEFGLTNCYGKIERGLTNSILRNRKELNLNQILKKRSALIPSSNTYGNYYVNNHNDELWGILYLSKPSDGEEQQTINIPQFSIGNISNNSPINNGIYYQNYSFSGGFEFYLTMQYKYQYYDYFLTEVTRCKATIRLEPNGTATRRIVIEDFVSAEDPTSPLLDNAKSNSIVFVDVDDVIHSSSDAAAIMAKYVDTCLLNLFDNPSEIYNYPQRELNKIGDYSNVVIKEDNKYYRYSQSNKSSSFLFTIIKDEFLFSITTGELDLVYEGEYHTFRIHTNALNYNSSLQVVYDYKQISKTEISEEEAGEVSLNINQDLIDEPYIIMVVPLFDVTIKSNDNTETFNISRYYSFNVFNTIVQYLSGLNGYLVDAQVYPYCPLLSSVQNRINGIPIFGISSNSYNHSCYVDLEPFNDIKKEYIARSYSILSPEQSDKFYFNFYDYKTSNSSMNIVIKTALKPFSIISSAVISKDVGSLMGFNYDSELNGCQPSANGFEVSLATNQYQEYMRNNSNYEKIFNKNLEYLKRQQGVERTNESASFVANVGSGAMMGAIGGFSVGGPVGGIVGGVGAGVTNAFGMGIQKAINDELRDYEYELQQEIFDLNIGTIKNLPNTINRVSSFNEIILKDFWFIVETYECSQEELEIVDNFIKKYSYSIGVYDYFYNYIENGRFIKGELITSSYIPNLHTIANRELKGGIYYYGS